MKRVFSPLSWLSSCRGYCKERWNQTLETLLLEDYRLEEPIPGAAVSCRNRAFPPKTRHKNMSVVIIQTNAMHNISGLRS